MAKRKTVTITVDEDLWRIAGALLPCSRSKFLETQLRTYLNSIDDIEKLEKELKEEKQAIKVKEEKIKQLREMRELNNENKEIIFKAMETVRSIVFEHNAVSKTQIKFIASSNGLDEDVLTGEIKKENIKIAEYTQDYHNGKIRNIQIPKNF